MNAIDTRTACGHVAAVLRRCATEGCGHPDVLHDLVGDNTTRKACSISSGRDATPCGCPAFTEQEVSAP